MEIKLAHNSNLREIHEANIEKMLGILCTSESEKQVLIKASGQPERTIELARHVSKPRSTVQDMLRRLEKRHLIYKIDSIRGKNPYWKSDLRKTIRTLNRLLWKTDAGKIYRDI